MSGKRCRAGGESPNRPADVVPIESVLSEMRSFADGQERERLFDLRNLATDSLRAYADIIEIGIERLKAEYAKADIGWEGICGKCAEGEISPWFCRYYGEPDGCNSPIRGSHPIDGFASGHAMMEALKAIRDFEKARVAMTPNGQDYRPLIEDALSVPTRNCDLYRNSEEAWEAFEKESAGMWSADWDASFAKWLFSPSKEPRNRGKQA